MTAVEELAKGYLDVLEISEADALNNAKHLLKYVQAVDKDGVGYTTDNMRPIVRIVEYITNPEKTQRFVDYCNEHNSEPDWASDDDFGLKGFMLPYLGSVPEGIEPVRNVLAFAINSEYYNQDKKPALMISEIDMISDKSFK